MKLDKIIGIAYIVLLTAYIIGLLTGVVKPPGYCSVMLYRVQCEYLDDFNFNESISYTYPVLSGMPFTASLSHLEVNATYRFTSFGKGGSTVINPYNPSSEESTVIIALTHGDYIIFSKALHDPRRGHGIWVDIFKLGLIECGCEC